jgi:hypothetical protein
MPAQNFVWKIGSCSHMTVLFKNCPMNSPHGPTFVFLKTNPDNCSGLFSDKSLTMQAGLYQTNQGNKGSYM